MIAIEDIFDSHETYNYFKHGNIKISIHVVKFIDAINSQVIRGHLKLSEKEMKELANNNIIDLCKQLEDRSHKLEEEKHILQKEWEERYKRLEEEDKYNLQKELKDRYMQLEEDLRTRYKESMYIIENKEEQYKRLEEELRIKYRGNMQMTENEMEELRCKHKREIDELKASYKREISDMYSKQLAEKSEKINKLTCEIDKYQHKNELNEKHIIILNKDKEAFIDKINGKDKYIDLLKDKCDKYEKTWRSNTSINDKLTVISDVEKGRNGEAYVGVVLAKLLKTSNIQYMNKTPHSGDIWLTIPSNNKKSNEIRLLIECKNKLVITDDDNKKFISDVMHHRENNNIDCGIMVVLDNISLPSKTDYGICLHEGVILGYVNNISNDEKSLKHMIDMVCCVYRYINNNDTVEKSEVKSLLVDSMKLFNTTLNRLKRIAINVDNITKCCQSIKKEEYDGETEIKDILIKLDPHIKDDVLTEKKGNIDVKAESIYKLIIGDMKEGKNVGYITFGKNHPEYNGIEKNEYASILRRVKKDVPSKNNEE